MKQEMLNNLMIHKEHTDELDLKQVANDFVSIKHRCAFLVLLATKWVGVVGCGFGLTTLNELAPGLPPIIYNPPPPPHPPSLPPFPPSPIPYRYKVMLECWAYRPAERPKFSTLVGAIGKNLEETAGYLFPLSLMSSLQKKGEISGRREYSELNVKGSHKELDSEPDQSLEMTN